jgi:hypothetical protein
MTRPYETEAELIANEGWSVGKNSFLLIDHPPLPPETLVRCEVVLKNSAPVIRAEGVVVRYVEPTETRAGGPQIRIQRVTPATKAFFARAQERRSRNGMHSIGPRPAAPDRIDTPKPVPAPWNPSGAAVQGNRDALRVLAERPKVLVPVPADRDALLARLRGRKAERDRRAEE